MKGFEKSSQNWQAQTLHTAGMIHSPQTKINDILESYGPNLLKVSNCDIKPFWRLSSTVTWSVVSTGRVRSKRIQTEQSQAPRETQGGNGCESKSISKPNFNRTAHYYSWREAGWGNLFISKPWRNMELVWNIEYRCFVMRYTAHFEVLQDIISPDY